MFEKPEMSKSDNSLIAKKQSIRELLQEALDGCRKLNEQLAKSFPSTEFKDKTEDMLYLRGLSTDEKIALGDQKISRMKEISFQIAPEKTMDYLEKTLCTESKWKNQAEELLGRIKEAK
jgi:hypothetical protein